MLRDDALEYARTLLRHYGEYHHRKEREAYVTAAAYIAGMSAVLAQDFWKSWIGQRPWVHSALLGGVAGVSVLALFLVGWQLRNRTSGARWVAAALSLYAMWLPEAAPINVTQGKDDRIGGRRGAIVPHAVAKEWRRCRACSTWWPFAWVLLLMALMGAAAFTRIWIADP